MSVTNPVHTTVREHYAEIARSSSSCCGSNTLYDAQLLKEVPSDVSGFSLGCGDPISVAALRPGETVLDLGSGGGLDCFLAAKQVGAAGHVIGVDMTPEMLAKARANAVRLKIDNVEFREGYLEALPVEDASIDVVISNCVINLSPDKPQVFREMFRALKPGGRVAVSDIVTNGSLPPSVQKNMEAWGACLAGALDVNDYTRGLREAGFTAVRVQAKSDLDQALAVLSIPVPFSATVTARRPGLDEKTTGNTADENEWPAIDRSTAQAGVIESLMSRVIDLEPIEDGYELRFAGDPIELGELTRTFIQSPAASQSPLRFTLIDGGTRVRVHLSNTSRSADQCCN